VGVRTDRDREGQKVMIYSNQQPEQVQSFLVEKNWQLGHSYPGPDAYYPSRTTLPHLHLTTRAGTYRLTWYGPHGKHGSIDATSDHGCPGTLREASQELVYMLQVGDTSHSQSSRLRGGRF
jgi:hypothetical protein